MLYEVPGTHLNRGAGADRCRPESCLGGRLGQRRDLRLFEIFRMSEINAEKNNLIVSTGKLATLGSLYTSLVSGRRISSYAVVEPYPHPSIGLPTRRMLSKPSPRLRCRRPLH